MIILRPAHLKDISDLDQLSQLAAEKHPGFLNVPQDPEGWREKVEFSQQSFAGLLDEDQIGKFIFVAEDRHSGRVVGTSMICSQHGTPDSPHFYFQVGSEHKMSQTINTGFIHGTLQLKYETNGPSEIGGLLVAPEFRSHESRIGRQISFVRFLYLSIYRDRFRSKLLAELLPPLTKKGKSPLWEAIGRRFTNMDYWEADYLSSKNKEFILSLFPTGTIYLTFLSAEARNAVGKVSKDTEPVMHMLKKIGFQYHNQVDPFDGGPHLVADVDELQPLKKLVDGPVSTDPWDGPGVSGLVVSMDASLEGREFKSVAAEVFIRKTSDGLDSIHLKQEVAKAAGLKPGQRARFMPFY